MTKRKLKGFTLIELMIVVAIIGILAAIAIPNFIKFQARSKQGEAKTNLKSLFTAQKTYFAEKDTYSSLMGTIGFSPERGNRYAMRMDPACVWEGRAATAPTNTGVATCIEVDTFRFVGSTAQPVVDAASSAVLPAPPVGNTALTTQNEVQATAVGGFSALALGNADNDSSIDSWLMSSYNGTFVVGTCFEAANNPAGTAYNTYNDVSCP